MPGLCVSYADIGGSFVLKASMSVFTDLAAASYAARSREDIAVELRQ